MPVLRDWDLTVDADMVLRGEGAEGQAELFALMDGVEAGITLTGGYMMVPRKSLSLVLGLRRERSPVGRACDHCHLRESCRCRECRA